MSLKSHIENISQYVKQELDAIVPLVDEANHYRHLKATERLLELDYAYRMQPRTLLGLDKIFAAGRHAEFCRRFDQHADRLKRIPIEETPGEPYWSNGWIPVIDGISLYGIAAEFKPSNYIEVGSGNSTKFVRRAIKDLGLSTRMTSIDPYPRAEIDELCDVVIRQPVEDVDLSVFEQLEPGDVVFIDNSHRSFPGSDVTIFFTEILPRLQKGVIWGLHDIPLPYDYTEGMAVRGYNEAYLFAAYLLGGAGGDAMLFGSAYVARTMPEKLTAMTPELAELGPWGGCLWMRKA